MTCWESSRFSPKALLFVYFLCTYFNLCWSLEYYCSPNLPLRFRLLVPILTGMFSMSLNDLRLFTNLFTILGSLHVLISSVIHLSGQIRNLKDILNSPFSLMSVSCILQSPVDFIFKSLLRSFVFIYTAITTVNGLSFLYMWHAFFSLRTSVPDILTTSLIQTLNHNSRIKFLYTVWLTHPM